MTKTASKLISIALVACLSMGMTASVQAENKETLAVKNGMIVHTEETNNEGDISRSVINPDAVSSVHIDWYNNGEGRVFVITAGGGKYFHEVNDGSNKDPAKRKALKSELQTLYSDIVKLVNSGESGDGGWF